LVEQLYILLPFCFFICFVRSLRCQFSLQSFIAFCLKYVFICCLVSTCILPKVMHEGSLGFDWLRSPFHADTLGVARIGWWKSTSIQNKISWRWLLSNVQFSTSSLYNKSSSVYHIVTRYKARYCASLL
jgi:hypothetical protein